MPYNRYLAAVLQFVTDVTDPYLNLFRRFLPLVRMGPGALDLSPIVATLVLIIVRLDRGRADPGRPGAPRPPRRRHRRAGRGRRPGHEAARERQHRARGDVNVFFGLEFTNTRNTGVASARSRAPA